MGTRSVLTKSPRRAPSCQADRGPSGARSSCGRSIGGSCTPRSPCLVLRDDVDPAAELRLDLETVLPLAVVGHVVRAAGDEDERPRRFNFGLVLPGPIFLTVGQRIGSVVVLGFRLFLAAAQAR
jgi:hypothetical protein